MNSVYKLHTRLIKTGLHKDPVSVRQFLLACVPLVPESLPYARSVFDLIPNPDTFSWNTLIRAHSRASPSVALSLFYAMHRNGVSPDHFTFPFVLKACALLQRGQELHALILKLGLYTDIFVMNALIHMFGCCGLVNIALKVFDEIPRRDLVSWSSLITCFANNGFGHEALAVFREMQVTTSITPDEVTMVSLISTVSSLGALELGRWLRVFMYRNGFDLSVLLGTSLIDMFSRCGSIAEARAVFDEMPTRNAYTWTALINGLAVHGQSGEALRMFHEMKKSGLRPDCVTFIGVLLACSHGGLVEYGWQVFASIKNEYDMEPMPEHYGCMVDLLGRAGLLTEAYEFLVKMPIRPNSILWRTLLGACAYHGNLELAKQVKEKISALDPNHDGDYVLLSNIYGCSGRWAEKAGLRNLMKVQMIEKKPGCSLIEVDQMIHEFVAGDNLHSQSKEIREFLFSIIERLRVMGYVPDTSNVLFDIEEEEKEYNLNFHSEKLAVAFGLLNAGGRRTIKVMKNLRICQDCHSFMKLVSNIYDKDIIIRDRNRFHHFSKGICSCKDYW
ncbi:pentatricopeptide repeat-containing protein At5g48910-like [Telopea speciosissima]|uniref:pentatricopeptide repeat-containing protein At5g48910-like n=1 Tax=Telopea speciosissima TaxID=54955 RepID=UPI001CC4AAF5|nr:pentatricopeptide repeat-containing protein At5g48910-like [Telopea speciosissima]